MFSGPPQPPRKCRFKNGQDDLVRLSDGTVGFVRNAFDAEMDQMFAEVMEELLARSLRKTGIERGPRCPGAIPDNSNLISVAAASSGSSENDIGSDQNPKGVSTDKGDKDEHPHDREPH